MTCNNIILSQPQAGSTLNHEIPNDVSARLNFGPDDISGLRLGGEGELVISFNGGGQLNITNFDDVIDNGNLLYLEDGTLIDPSILTGALKSPQDFNSIETAAGAATDADAIRIGQPAANTTQSISATSGQKYVCDFDPSNANVEVRDGKMYLTFADGSQIVINNFEQAQLPEGLIPAQEILTEVTEVAQPIEEILQIAEAGEPQQVAEAPRVEVQESIAEQVSNIQPAAGEDIAQTLANIEPAAGETGGTANSGYGFNSSPTAAPLNSINAIGPLGATQLAYNAPNVNPENPFILSTPIDPAPVLSSDPVTLDETNTANGELVKSGEVNVNYGGQGPNADGLIPNGDFVATCNVDGEALVDGGFQLSSGGVDVVVTATDNGYIGTADGVTVFTFVLDPETGEFDYTQIEPFDHSDTSDDNEAICLDFGVQVTDTTGDTRSTNVRINVLDDAPVLTSQPIDIVDETDFVNGQLVTTGNFSADMGEDVGGSYTGNDNGFNVSGSVAGNNLTSNGVDVEVTFDAATNTYTGTAGGETVFTMVVDPATGDYTYTQFGPLDHADATDPNDAIDLNFDVTVTDFDGDSATGQIRVRVLDDAPITGDDVNTIDETSLDGGDIVITDSVDVDFGNDGQGALVPNGTFTAGGSLTGGTLTSNGVEVVVTKTDNGYVGVAGGVTVFELEIDPTTGDYTFTLKENLDHADGNDDNDVISLNFGTIITDYDGDSDAGQITINIKDDAPEANDDTISVEEGETQTGNVITNNDEVGADDPGAITNVRFEGVDYPVAENGTTVIEGNYGTLTIESNGDYSYVANNVDGGIVADTSSLNPTAADAAGTQNSVTKDGITITASNGGDISWFSDPALGEGFGVTGGSGGDKVFGNEALAIDFANPVDTASISIGDMGANNIGSTFEYEVRLEDGSVINQMVTIDAANVVDGVFTFDVEGFNSPIAGVDLIGGPSYILSGVETETFGDDKSQDTFTYTLVDSDGDSDTANLDICVENDPAPINIMGVGATDDTNLSNGNDVETGVINVNYQGDGPGVTTGNGDFASTGNRTGNKLTSNGVDVDVTFDEATNTYTGTANGQTVFTMVIGADGEYTFTQSEPLDHSNTNADNEAIFLDFGVTATDSDGDTGTGTVRITVRDDAPEANDDALAVQESGTANGNVITANDDAGQDTPGTITQVVFNGVATAVPATGTVDVVGTYGTLTIAADGTYSYTAIDDNPDGVDEFIYTLRDFDGDTDTAKLSITVSKINDIPVVNPEIKTVDETDGTDSVSGTINVDFGGDAPGEVNPNGEFDASVPNLTSCGHDVNVTLDGNTYTGTANGQTVFTMTINEDGSYTFNQLEAIDHPNTVSDNDVVNLVFGATATDSDDDSVNTTVTIRVLDDGPEIDNTTQEVDEGDIANGQNLVATGAVVADFGQDGPGEITANGLFEAKFQRDGSNVTLSSGGNAIAVTNTDNVYTGTANGQVVFTLAIDPATGEYTYTQMGPIDHPDDQDPDDVIWLKFYADITDCDGDHDTGVIVIDVHDDAPVAVNDTDTAAEGTVVTGNVLDNDDAGADLDASVVEVQFNGQTFAVPATGSTTVTGQYGELTIKADGTYSYEANDNNPDGVDRFTYVMQDGDGDKDTAVLSITVTSVDGVPTIESQNVPYSEAELADGKITINGTLDFDFGADGAGSITPNGITVTRFEIGGAAQTLTSGGVEVVFTQTASGYIGKAGNVTVLTLEIDPQTGEYTYQQCAPVDHPDTGVKNGDEVIWVKFGVQITDADGDTAEAVINFDIKDDTPEAVNDTDAAAEGETVTGNVLDNDDVGVDGNGMVCEVKFGNQTFAVPATGSVTVTGQYGELTIKADGTYSYKANNNNPDGVDVFDYTMKDGDDDTSSATLSITVTNVNDVPTIKTSVTGVNEVDLCDHPLVVNKTFEHSFGDDGAGKIEVNGNTAVKFKVGGQDQTLESNGVPIVISQSGNGYVGKAGNLTVFTMTLNGQTGEYTYTQFAGVDHPGVGKAGTDDVIWLKLGVSITDSDGDSADAYVNIDIRDTAPEANDDTNAVDEGERATGNVLSNDENCEDGSMVCEVVFNGQTFAVPETGSVRVDGQYGTLRINANGGYSYVAKDNNPDGVDVFTYTMKDQDGDTSSADLSITVTSVNDVPTIKTSVTGVNEVDLCDHPLVVNKTFVHDFGDDGAGRFEANGNTAVKFKVGGQNQTLTSSGKAVVITNTADGYVGKAGGETVFTLDLNQQTGEYTYTQFASVDHPGVGVTGTNDVIWLKLGVSIFDKDGDRADAYVNIDIRDDAPTAVNDKIFTGGSVTFDSLDLNLSSSDVAGHSSSFARDGISINSNNGADLVWVNHTNGPGVGIAGEGTDKVFRAAEVLEVNFATAVTAATITLGDMGANNVGDNFKYEVFLSNGQSVTETVVIQGNGLVGETFKFDVSGYDADIVGVDLIGGPSFLLNDVQASSVDYTAGDAQGNVLLNDDHACGDDTVVTTISFEGRDYSVPANGDRTINGDNGKLTINAKGEYTYVSNTTPDQTIRSFNINNPGGSDKGGDIKNVSTQYNETTKDFTFTMVTDAHADGVEFAVNDGPNPKNHPGELAFFYIDGTGAEPVVTVYGYNGVSVSSWKDGGADAGNQSPDKIFSSITNPELFDNIVATTNADGTKTYSVSLNVDALQNHDPIYGPNGIWEGVEFGDKIGIWAHTLSDLETSYGNDGFLTKWDYSGLGWYDSSNQHTDTTTIPGQSGGDDTFTYTIRDEDGDISTATLEICVKDFDNVIEISGNGNFYGTDDADMFLFNALGAAGAARLNNFNLDEDAVDLGNVVQGFDPLTDAINDFVFVTENNGDTVIQIDTNGTAAGGRENVARLDGVTGESLEDLIENGNIIV